MNKSKKSSLVILGFSLLCFALPFISLSCNNQKLNITGIELVTGNDIQGRRLEPQPFALFALLASCVAFAITLASPNGKPKTVAILAGLGAAFLFVMKSQLDSQIARNGGFILAKWETGFWLALISDVVAVVIQFLVPVPSAVGVGSEVPPAASSPTSPPD